MNASATTPTSNDAANSVTEGPTILGAILSLWVVALIVLVLRFVARRLSRVSVWTDDWLVAAAFVFYTATVACFIGSEKEGAGRHQWTITPTEYTKVEIFFLSGEVLFTIAVNLPKLSVLAFYWRIFASSPKLKKPVLFTSILVVLWLVASLFLLIFQCSPVKKLAHPEIPGHCLDKRSLFVGGSVPNLVLDVIILVLPIPFVWSLHASKRQKFALSGLFLLGGLACISSAIRMWAFAVRDYASPDHTWTTTDSIIWSCTEVALAIIAASVLSLRPILTYLRTGSGLQTSKAEQQYRARLKESSGASSDLRKPISTSHTVSDASTTHTRDSAYIADPVITQTRNWPEAQTWDVSTTTYPTGERAVPNDNPPIAGPLELPGSYLWGTFSSSASDLEVPLAVRDENQVLTALPSLGPGEHV